MLSKYDESASNINSIEDTIEALMCELGIGGFMGTEDILPGMKLSANLDQHYYDGELVSRDNNTLTISLPESPVSFTSGNIQKLLRLTLRTPLLFPLSQDLKLLTVESIPVSILPIAARLRFPKTKWSFMVLWIILVLMVLPS